MLVEAALGDDICTALCLSTLQRTDPDSHTTQAVILVRDKQLIAPIVDIIRQLDRNIVVGLQLTILTYLNIVACKLHCEVRRGLLHGVIGNFRMKPCPFC